MKISTLIPNYNDGLTLERAVRSACDQNRYRVMVLDDASTDDSVAVVELLIREYPQLRLYRYPVMSDNWLRDLFWFASYIPDSDYVHFLAADDYLQPGFYRTASPCTQGVVIAGVITRRHRRDWAVAVHRMPPGSHGRGPLLLKWVTDPKTMPSGTAALFRADVAAWFADQELWRVGPWNDSVGIPLAAWLFGLDVVPVVGGVHSVADDRYGAPAMNPNGKRLEQYHETERLCERLRAAHADVPELEEVLSAARAKVAATFGGVSAIPSTLPGKTDVTSEMSDAVSGKNDVTSLLESSAESLQPLAD